MNAITNHREARQVAKLLAEFRHKELANRDEAHLLEFAGDDENYYELFRRFAPAMLSVLAMQFPFETAMEAFAETWYRVKQTGGRIVDADGGPVQPALFSLAHNFANQV